MHVSPNIIRFPVPAEWPVRQTEEAGQRDNLVAFPRGESSLSENSAANIQLPFQEFGQIFAAHRIVGRIADDLDAVAGL